MTTNDLREFKVLLMKCITEDFNYGNGRKRPKVNQAIFDKDHGWAVFNNTDLEMVEDKIDLAIKLFKEERGMRHDR